MPGLDTMDEDQAYRAMDLLVQVDAQAGVQEAVFFAVADLLNLEPRIRAHVLLCWLALLLIRVAERRTGQTCRRIEIELGRVHAVTLTGTAGSVIHITPLSTVQAGILRACQVPPPAAVTALHPA